MRLLHTSKDFFRFNKEGEGTVRISPLSLNCRIETAIFENIAVSIRQFVIFVVQIYEKWNN